MIDEHEISQNSETMLPKYIQKCKNPVVHHLSFLLLTTKLIFFCIVTSPSTQINKAHEESLAKQQTLEKNKITIF